MPTAEPLQRNEIAVDATLAAEHGLTADEFARTVELTGRTPTFTELGIWSAMWNEHCSYKSSRKWLRTLPSDGPRVIEGPGENAGVVDIGDGLAVVFKMESHNHPSFIEPYQGAATGVGGILRDVFTMGARPVAAMNALRFGDPDHAKTRHLVAGVVAGVGGYGNSFGVPVVGGEVGFHRRYNGNILVNAFAAGIARTDQIFRSKAKGVGLPVVYLGAKTGRDGVGGATMASAEFGDAVEEKRPTVQVGDPFTEKCLLEACMELMQTGAVIAIQDMGAAGLTCSAVEMGAKGDLGIELDLDLVPCREIAMTAYEMMLSESQERMLMVLRPDKQAVATAIFEKWGLDFAVVGKTTDDLRFRILHGGETVADLPIKELGDAAPEYDRPYLVPPSPAKLDRTSLSPIVDWNSVLLKLVASPQLCSRRWVYEQYDTLIQANTLQTPGGNAGVVRVEGGQKALAFTSDCTPRYCEADPYEGGKQAVAECYRNLCAVGALPLAASDNLNFGNPERPEIMGQLVAAIGGIGEACKALSMPIVSGNVSLYNETNGRAIPPTPVICGVGLIDDHAASARIGGATKGQAIYLLGGNGSQLGQSVYLQVIHGLESGAPPPVDLANELRNGTFVRGEINDRRIKACHDISDGGMAVALAELCIANRLGAKIALSGNDWESLLFGEDQARYLAVVDCADQEQFTANSARAGVPIQLLGHFAGDCLTIDQNISIPISALQEVHEAWFPTYMSGETSADTQYG